LDKHLILAVEDIIIKFLDRIYTGFEVVNSYIFRLTRDADLTVEEEGAEDLLKLIENELSKRKKGRLLELNLTKICQLI